MHWSWFIGPGGAAGHSPFGLHNHAKSPMPMFTLQILWYVAVWILLRCNAATWDAWRRLYLTPLHDILYGGIPVDELSTCVLQSGIFCLWMVGSVVHVVGIAFLITCCCSYLRGG